jgi:hypothetical protein
MNKPSIAKNIEALKAHNKPIAKEPSRIFLWTTPN